MFVASKLIACMLFIANKSIRKKFTLKNNLIFLEK